MPIKINIKDNNSTIKVKPKDNREESSVTLNSNLSNIKSKVKDNSKEIEVDVKDESQEVKVKTGCDIKEKVLDNKINKETQERIHADEKERNERIIADERETQEREEAIAQEVRERVEAIEHETQAREEADERLEQQIQEIIVGGVSVDNTTIVFNDKNEVSLNQLLNANYYVVENIRERDAIPNALKKKGTIVKVDATQIVYTWDGVNWKKSPVNILSLGNGLKLSDTGELSVDTTDEAIALNKQPITSNGVFNILGDINDRLEQI